MITCRAPGKLFVAGEYAVLEPGAPAVLVAVDRYATVTVAETTGIVCIVSDLAGGSRIQCERIENRLIPVGTSAAIDDCAYVLAAASAVEQLLAERGGRLASFEMTCTGRDLVGRTGGKLGLGSSAAVTVAAVGALAAFYGLDLDRMDRYRLAMLATLAVNPHASGGDVAAATWGGWIAYRTPDRDHITALATEYGSQTALQTDWPGLSIRPLRQPTRMRLLVGWTGHCSSTVELTSRIHRGHRRIRDFPAFLADSCASVERLIAAIGADDVTAVQHEIHRARAILADLDKAADLGICTSQLEMLCAIADVVGAAAKSSGAGGGDCGIAICAEDHAGQAAELTRRWIDAGIEPVPLHIHSGEGEQQCPHRT
jgi:phosphomevalonate kinase